MNKDELQAAINETYYQDFKLREIRYLEPNSLAAHKLKFMEDKFLNGVKGKRILDVGCSFGFFCIEAKKRGAAYVLGIDQSQKSILLARQVAKFVEEEIDYRCERFSEKLLKDGRFDVTILCSLYHYIWGDYKDHYAIFKLLSELTDYVFFENPLNMKDPSCREYFEKNLTSWMEFYKSEIILTYMGHFFDYEYLGNHLHEHRKIYWLRNRFK